MGNLGARDSNQVGIWFNRTRQQAIRRGTFRSVKELVEKNRSMRSDFKQRATFPLDRRPELAQIGNHQSDFAPAGFCSPSQAVDEYGPAQAGFGNEISVSYVYDPRQKCYFRQFTILLGSIRA
jgi:hypothetical protein